MKILLINGSPRGKASNSLRLAHSFVEGLGSGLENKEEVIVDELQLSYMKIGACRGCFACWKNTPGHCCLKDDMELVIQKEIEADLIIWSFPLYYFNVPGLLKNMIDRQLPMNLPFMSEREDGYGSGSHESRFDMKGKKHVLISTCGFYSAAGNYDSVRQMFNHFLGPDNYLTIFCGQGELFGYKELSERTDQYLSYVKAAGKEYAVGQLSPATQKKLGEYLYAKEQFEQMADASWGIDKETGEKASEELVFTRQMAAMYNKASYSGKDRVLEMHYTDRGTRIQILLGKDGSKVFTDGSLKASTIIETPFEVWAAISRGELSGSEALGKQLYSVSGDFSLMMKWDQIFTNKSSRAAKDSSQEAATEKDKLKKPSMTCMLIPWITFWVAAAINPVAGPLISLGICALLPLVMRKRKIVIWDQLSLALVAGLCLLTSFTKNGELATNLGYLLFGLMWLGSCLAKKPLCATYVKYDYEGEAAMKNPLFMKTNYILAAAWGSFYVLASFWTWGLRSLGLGSYLLFINNSLPLLMGLFTVWFQKWYPAKLARGKVKAL